MSIKTKYTCPICSGKAFWRHGMHFDHMKRCGKCNVSWVPGEWVRIVSGSGDRVWLVNVNPPNEITYEI